jgi:hypothetical protein
MVKFLKKKFNVLGLEITYIEDESDWVDGFIPILEYHGPVPTYLIENTNDIPWRIDNVKEKIDIKLRTFVKLIGDETRMRYAIPQAYKIIDWEGNTAYYIPSKIEQKIKYELKSFSNDKFFVLPNNLDVKNILKIKNTLFGLMSFECTGGISYEFYGDELTFFIDITNVKIKKSNDEPVEMDSDMIDRLIHYLNYEDIDFNENKFFRIFDNSGLLRYESFYDPEIDVARFYLVYNN